MNLGILKQNQSKIIKKSDLPHDFREICIFIHVNKLINNLNLLPVIPNEMKLLQNGDRISKYIMIIHRHHIGELPDNFLNKKLSIISCSPMIQNKNIFNYLFFVNLRKDPKKLNSKLNY